MSKGCLVFAFNNGIFDYVKLANSSAIQIKKQLNLPTSIITDAEISFEHNFEHIILVKKPSSSNRFFHDIKETKKWVNGDRCNAYDLSPYDQTILLDADYVVSSNILNNLFKSNSNILYHKYSYNIIGDKTFEYTSNKFGIFSMPMSWATVIYFRKCEYSKTFFDVMKMVQQHYNHYSQLYNFSSTPFRNDYALSIADNLMNGHMLNDMNKIPWNLAAVMPDDDVVKVGDNMYEIIYNDGKDRVIAKDYDLHIMGKVNLKKIYEC